jgi:hypothetical protein
LQGALNSSIIDWCGDVIIIAQEQDETLQVSLTIDAESLRFFESIPGSQPDSPA